MQPKSKTQSKTNSTTRSLDTRSTSCDREEELNPVQQRLKQKLAGMHFTMAQPFRSNRGTKRKEDYPDLRGKKIETVLEEEETENPEDRVKQGRLPLLFDLQESSGGLPRRRGSLPERSKRSRSTELQQLPNVDETKEEYFYDLQQKMVFGRKLNILFDRSEKKPSDGEAKEKRGSVVAIDCLTIEEEDAEDVQIDPIDLLSQDFESSSRSKVSSPLSKPISKKHLVVDEMSADGEAKKRPKFDPSVNWSVKQIEIEPIMEEEEEAPKVLFEESHVVRKPANHNLLKIIE